MRRNLVWLGGVPLDLTESARLEVRQLPSKLELPWSGMAFSVCKGLQSENSLNWDTCGWISRFRNFYKRNIMLLLWSLIRGILKTLQNMKSGNLYEAAVIEYFIRNRPVLLVEFSEFLLGLGRIWRIPNAVPWGRITNAQKPMGIPNSEIWGIWRILQVKKVTPYGWTLESLEIKQGIANSLVTSSDILSGIPKTRIPVRNGCKRTQFV